MIRIENTYQLREYVSAFLNQRRKAYQSVKQYEKAELCGTLLQVVKSLEQKTYLQHCITLNAYAAHFFKILPSNLGKHKSIRERFLIFLNQVNLISQYPEARGVQTTGSNKPDVLYSRSV